jgi:hypothetical protein
MAAKNEKNSKKNFALFLRFFFCALWAGDRNTYIIWDTCTRTDILYKGQNILRHRQHKDKNQKQITKDNGILASENKMSRPFPNSPQNQDRSSSTLTVEEALLLPSRRVPPQFQQYQPITITIQNNSKTKFIQAHHTMG